MEENIDQTMFNIKYLRYSPLLSSLSLCVYVYIYINTIKVLIFCTGKQIFKEKIKQKLELYSFVYCEISLDSNQIHFLAFI
jgi:hypothetical protein